MCVLLIRISMQAHCRQHRFEIAFIQIVMRLFGSVRRKIAAGTADGLGHL
jgi:hypothetical protein